MKLRNIVLLTSALLMSTNAFAWPWSTDMMNQPNIKPQEGTPAPFPKRSIPVQGIPTEVANREEAKTLQNPVPVSADSVKKGRYLYTVYCSACHGLTGRADSPISPKIGAIDLTTEYVQDSLAEGWIYGTITFGSVIMPAYGKPGEGGGSNDLSVTERWHVVNYVRNQLVKDAAGSATASAE